MRKHGRKAFVAPPRNPGNRARDMTAGIRSWPLAESRGSFIGVAGLVGLVKGKALLGVEEVARFQMGSLKVVVLPLHGIREIARLGVGCGQRVDGGRIFPI